VYTRNGSFNVDDSGFIVDGNGQFLLGYPVDSDGAVSDKTLSGSVKMQLQTEYGDPKETNRVGMGVNLPADAPVISASSIFDANDPKTYSASSSVTIFDNMGNPKSATIFYLKTQDPSGADQTFKYDTKMFVDGEEIKPTLTRATNARGVDQFIDKFGQKTTLPPDPAYILGGKGSALYRADDLGAPLESTPAMLTGLNLQTYLGDGKTVEIVTDPKHFKRTVEYQSLQGQTPLANSPFWGRDFLLVDVDGSGPVSVDIAPGTYNGVQLAAEVENALRDGFGDDKKIQLTDNIDSKFTLDIKKLSGDGKSTGLLTPVEIDIHTASIVQSDVAKIKEGLVLEDFLTHAQILMTEGLNGYTRDGVGADATKATELNVNGRLFKKAVGTAIANNAIPTAFDVVKIEHKNDQVRANGDKKEVATGGTLGGVIERFMAYSNVNNVPEVKAYDYMLTKTDVPLAKFTKSTDGYLEISVATNKIIDKPEVFRFQQNAAAGKTTKLIEQVGSAEVAVKSSKVDPNDAARTLFKLDHLVIGNDIINGGNGTEADFNILAKPSQHIEAYFESTKDLVEGVDKVFYSNKIVLQEIGNSAKRNAGDATTAAAGSIKAVKIGTPALSVYGLDANGGVPATTTDW
ncbi:MAG: flagellar basal body FlgE domain-containing protein, partial [Flavobacteriaceae bacterium]